MIRRGLLFTLYKAMERRREQRLRERAKPCTRDRCRNYPVGTIHYHWGYGQLHDGLTPVTGYGSFSDGEPFIRVSPRP